MYGSLVFFTTLVLFDIISINLNHIVQHSHSKTKVKQEVDCDEYSQ